MEYYWTLFNNSNGSTTSNCVRRHNGNSTANHAWDQSLDLDTTSGSTSRPNWSYPLHNSLNYPPPTATAADFSVGAFHALMLRDQEKSATGHSCSSATTSSSLYIGKEPPHYNYNPDPHLTCLKLGKRHYFEDATPPVVGERQVSAVGPFSMTKKGKSYTNATAGRHPAPPVDSAAAVVPLCQVEGCEAVLVNAKDYHRRHKVCEMHAKAPKVVVLGIEQRFCQQCSRFHAVAEFDEAKRSCRRRLAGHNERRRKSSQEQNSLARKHSQDIKMMAVSRHPHFLNNSECALSLLSSTHYTPWNISTSPDLPSRCSAALRELIAENRASILACRQLINANQIEDYKLGSVRAGPNPQESGGHVTLNLMQAPNSAFGLLSVHGHKSSKEDDEQDCSELWNVPLGY